ncbi:MAG: AraC family ligand binding domain-containing protein [Treponema sp.]|nr:AraC family ligand binding domain-containing protein [Treponema sp.]
MSKKTATGYTTVQTDETLRETISHGTSNYSFKFYDETMDMFDFRCIDWHWHSELEIVLVEKGNVDCFIGTEHVVLNAGSVLFINSKIIHKFTSEENAVIPNLLFLPAFISPEDSLIYKKYILPVLQNDRAVDVHLSKHRFFTSEKFLGCPDPSSGSASNYDAVYSAEL